LGVTQRIEQAHVAAELARGGKVKSRTVNRVGQPVLGGRGVVEIDPQQIAVGQWLMLGDALALLLNIRRRGKSFLLGLQLLRDETAIQQNRVFREHKRKWPVSLVTPCDVL
jgi:hypothetical protein